MLSALLVTTGCVGHAPYYGEAYPQPFSGGGYGTYYVEPAYPVYRYGGRVGVRHWYGTGDYHRDYYRKGLARPYGPRKPEHYRDEQHRQRDIARRSRDREISKRSQQYRQNHPFKGNRGDSGRSGRERPQAAEHRRNNGDDRFLRRREFSADDRRNRNIRDQYSRPENWGRPNRQRDDLETKRSKIEAGAKWRKAVGADRFDK